MLQKALDTNNATDPWGTEFGYYNPECDINYGTWNMVGQTPQIVGDGDVTT